jgi:hypothetical protein
MDHTAALTRDGGVFTFGAGMYGQLGHCTSANEMLPRKVLELMGTTVTQICCGRCECHFSTASAINFDNFLLGYFLDVSRLLSFRQKTGYTPLDWADRASWAPSQLPM